MIHVGDGTKLSLPRLVERVNGEVQGPYVTLSYCWGGKNGFKLTSSTIEGLKHGIDPFKLPRTIQDAICFTRQLNIPYIWIDSLCIMQDSKDDWEREAATMSKVYINCFLTIAALGASHAEQGLFARRNPLVLHQCFLLQNAKGENVYVEPPLKHVIPIKMFDGAPLHERAWVMQERLLSPRTLNFSASLVWECREAFLDEYGSFPPEEWKLSNVKSRLLDYKPNQQGDRSQDLWKRKILGDYTAAQLSVKSNRLMAIAGIIDSIEQRTGQKNIHGLWEADLLEELLWKSWGIPESRLSEDIPTWSWGSVSTPVVHHLTRHPIDDYVFRAQIEGIEHDIPTEASQSRGRKCKSLAKGKTGVRISSLFVGLERLESYELVEVKCEPPPPRRFAEFSADVQPITAPGPYFFLLLMQSNASEFLMPESRVYGLALARSRSVPLAFERIGFVEGSDTNGYVIEEGYNERRSILLV